MCFGWLVLFKVYTRFEPAAVPFQCTATMKLYVCIRLCSIFKSTVNVAQNPFQWTMEVIRDHLSVEIRR